MKHIHALFGHIARAKQTIYLIAGVSFLPWLLRLGFFRRYVYMGYDQARDSYIFYNISQGFVPDYGPYALSGGYAMPNYYYRIYAALNWINPADPVYQALPFVVLSAASVSMALWLIWWLSGTAQPALPLRTRQLLALIPFFGIGLSYNELLNAPLIWNPTNLLFWQLGLFLLYVRIQTRQSTWQWREAVITWAALGGWSVLAASMHGTFLYAIPLWAAGILAFHLYKRRWFSLAYVAGVIAALLPYLSIDQKYDFANTKLMLGLSSQDSTLQQGVDFSVAHNLWNNLSQFAHKVLFGLDAPAAGWTIIVMLVLAASLPLMLFTYKQLRWYAWWICIYIAMASLFGGERGDATISWHYQQNIMLWPTIAVALLSMWLLRSSTVHVSKNRRLLSFTRLSVLLLLIVFCAGYAMGMQRMIARQYHAAYKPSNELMSTYEIESALATIPPSSTICVPVGYYHTTTFAYLSQVRLQRPNDTFVDTCGGLQSGYLFIPKYHYNFWPPHRSIATDTTQFQYFTTHASKYAETNKYIIYKIAYP